MVKEMQLQKSGLTASDAARIGRGLNAQKVVLGSVTRFGETTYVIQARVVEMVSAAKGDGMTTLVQDGILKALDGLTDLKQVKAVAIK